MPWASRAWTAAWATAGCDASAGLDLAGFDAEAADLHLAVDAAEAVEVAVGAPLGQVAGCGYMRAPGGPNGQAMKRSAVSPGRRA